MEKKNVFCVNGTMVYDMPVEKLNLPPRDIKRLKMHGILTASMLQKLTYEEKDILFKTENGQIDYWFCHRLKTYINSSSYVTVEGNHYRPNDDWAVFCMESEHDENGVVGYCFDIRKSEGVQEVMSYDQYITLMKELHKTFPTLSVEGLLTKLQKSDLSKPYIHDMILRKLTERSCHYKMLRKPTVLFSSPKVFQSILFDMLEKHEIDEYVDSWRAERLQSNAVCQDARFTISGVRDICISSSDKKLVEFQ